MREKSILVLIAEDDEEDRQLIREAWQEGRLVNELRFVGDGEELMDYLLHRGCYAEPTSSPRPDLILLDVNMPRKSGVEALIEMRADAGLRRIPVVALTASEDREDINRSYEAGVNSYITKPVTFAKLLDVLKTLRKYWFEIVELPPKTNGVATGGA